MSKSVWKFPLRMAQRDLAAGMLVFHVFEILA